MRPSKLVLENFGPYRERAEVDFSLLDPLFLVCGKTGSGKTSIFDAMTYALYGAAPGTRGGLERQLWSQHARPGEAPLVEFEFFLGGAEYRAVRRPPYRRSSRRVKEALVEVDASAAFYRREGGEWKLLADKKTEADQAIGELMGLTEDEFSKIILLPQGEFQRFLEMKSSDRVEVLEKLFPVRLHDAVSSIAKEKSKEALAELRRVDAELARLGGAAESEASETALRESSAELSRLEAERDRAVDRLQAASLAHSRAREAAEREARAHAARERLSALEAGAPAAAESERRIAAARAAARAEPALAAREAAEADLASVRSSLEEQRRRSALLASRSSEIEGLRAEGLRLGEETTVIDRELGELGAAQEAWNEALRAREGLEACRLRSTEAAARAEAARAAEALALEARNASIVSAEEEGRIREAFEADREASEKADAALKAAEAGAALAEKCLRLRAAAGSAKIAAEEAAIRLAEASASLARLEAAKRSGLAAGLALGLESGEACPVCGSLDHPALAHAPSGAPGAAEFDAAQAAKERSLAEEAAARAAAASAADRGSEAERELSEQGAGFDDFASRLTEARAEERRAAEAVAASAKRRRAMEERRRETVKLEAALEAARARRSAEETEAQAAAIARAKLEMKLETAVSGAGTEDPGPKAEEASARRERVLADRSRLEASVAAWEADRHRAEALAAELESRSGILVERLDAAVEEEAAALAESGFGEAAAAREARLGMSELAALEADAEAYRRGLDAARATAAAIEAEIAASASEDAEGPADEEGLAAEVTRAREARDGLQASLDAAVARVAELGREREERRRLSEERSRLESESGRLAGLSALLCGELPGRKLPFKNYVLGAYFRVVAERASARLSLMSDGRYSLAADEGSGRGYLGLELLVRDAHTGQARPAGTLSGGERFMAALSLAFGLADTIRERSGGTSLDAIFIDEGFGSLDDEALDRAVSVLDEARGARTVGIVSHVAELKARIPSRIEVAKGRSGSSLRIVS